MRIKQSNNIVLKRSQAKTRLGLYWVSTSDHDEDWFIFAPTKRLAARYHEDYEDYSIHTAKAELVMPAEQTRISGNMPIHAKIGDLKKLGFEILHSPDPAIRIVRLNGRVFVEGLLESSVVAAIDNWFENEGQGRPMGSSRQTHNQ